MAWRIGASRPLVVAGAVAASMLAGMGALALNGEDDTSGRVIRVIDGDTLVAEIAGDDVTVRLLNIDTPETKDPSEPVQCMGPEATDFLVGRLPVGTEIELEYDEERTDKYGRTLAGVYVGDSLINAEIAAAGMGVPVMFEPNEKLYPQVAQAYDGAVSAGRGLFDPEIDCTLPHQVEALAAQAEQIPTEPGADPAAAVTGAQQTVDAANDLAALIGDPAALEWAGHQVLSGETSAPADEAEDEAATEKERTAEKDRGATKRQTSDETNGAESQEVESEPSTKASSTKKADKASTETPSDKSTKKASKEKAPEEKAPVEKPAPEKTSAKRTPTEKATVGEPAPEKTTRKPEEKSTQKDSDSSGGSSSCVPYGPEYPYEKYGGPPYSGKRYGMPGGKTYRRCK